MSLLKKRGGELLLDNKLMETRLERAFKELASREELLDKSTRRWREMSHNSTKCQDKKSESSKEIEEKNKQT